MQESVFYLPDIHYLRDFPQQSAQFDCRAGAACRPMQKLFSKN